MNFEIAFKELPFEPEEKQVFFIENGYDQEINDSIRDSIDILKYIYADNGLTFIYFPLLLSSAEIEEMVRYYAPYLKAEIVTPMPISSSWLLGYMSNTENRDLVPPSILYNAHKEGEEWIFQGISIHEDAALCINESLKKICESFDENPGDDDTCYSIDNESEDISTPKSCVRFSARGNQSYILPEDFVAGQMIEEELGTEDDRDIQTVLRDLRNNVRRLKLNGISLAAIHELIDIDEPLSKLVITEDYRIFLPDYNNIEIEMTMLPKALFFLFLRYPEGIVLKHMIDHQTELVNIYKQLKPYANEAKIQTTISQLCNPSSNRINENITRISVAFRQKFDDHLAKNYYPLGKAGEPYKIMLNPKLIEWED